MQRAGCSGGMHRRRYGRRRAALLAVATLGCLIAERTSAQHIENGKAVFAALDKVTARISRLEVKLGETAKFGALQVTPRACHSRSPTEPPKTTSFVEIDEAQLGGKSERIFSGWMFAESPALNAVEHPVYDVWLTECIEPRRPVAAQAPAPGKAASTGEPSAVDTEVRRFRPKR
ncbi:MAG: DUF2155 domain-containing protein [Hyphomicrobiaceae bacterium]|nr:DUF2155 domain-containing protein [Hyphomicrobiaceae bacterium]